MSNEMKVFENEQFGQVRAMVIDGNPWFVAADVCKALDLNQVTNAIRKLDDDEKATTLISIKGGNGAIADKEINIVSESGLYSLVLGSRKPEAKAFKRWVTHEVIPSIRKHGMYATDEVIDKMIGDPDFAIKLFTTLKEEREKNKKLQATVETQAKKIEADKPKVRYYDIILQCEELLTPTQIAKDYGMSAIKFNRLLNEQHIQFRQGKKWILYQKYADLGWGQNQTSEYYTDYGFNCDTALRYTQVGRRGIYDKLKASGILPICER